MTKLFTRTIDNGGPPIVFLHGLMGQGKNFQAIAQSLPFTSLLIDAPDHGKSPWTDAFSYEAAADLTAETIRATFSEPVAVVGHSMGGKTAMMLALRHPELVRCLVVVDISPTPQDSRGEFDNLLSALHSLPVSELHSRSEASRLLEEKIPSEQVRAFLLQNLIRTSTGFAFQSNLKMLLHSLDTIVGFPEVHASYAGPVLWVSGGNSDYIQKNDMQLMQRLFPDTVPITISDSGHWVHADQPEQFTKLIHDFVTQEYPT
jgi:pimeloyl-ACP methyl ester carboxylesterase